MVIGANARRSGGLRIARHPLQHAASIVLVLLLLLVIDSVFLSITSTRRKGRQIHLATEQMLPTTSSRLAKKCRFVTTISAAVVRLKCFVRQR